ncbi:probable G-protein coupled receptor 34 [Clytia hemisphaerica]|uniref:G-protein coupled receptors family 1 profile domain-containing protein n=1 Tax=Clytia hemisphaerica TaxID=252671 RepID=A0A7M5TQC6_9CNID|eukprot:TCONS_00014089-protein
MAYKWVSFAHSFQNLELTNQIVIILLTIVFFLGIIGNAVVLFTFLKKRHRTVFEKRLVLLAIVDLVSSLCVPSLFIYGTLTHFHAPHLTEPVCKIWLSLFPMSVTISQALLVFISFERYHRIQKPFQRPYQIKYVFLPILVISVALVSPYTYTLKDFCRTQDMTYHKIYVILNVARDIISVLAMLYFNYRTGNCLNQNQDSICVSNHSNLKSKRIFRTLLKMVVVFTILVTPVDFYQFSVLNLMSSFPPYLNQVNTMLVVLQMFNSVANILIYSISDQNFRLKFLQSVKMTFKRNVKSGDLREEMNNKISATNESNSTTTNIWL